MTTRLTDLAHGGGCGCKLSPAVLADLLRHMPAAGAFPDLLVGFGGSDDAAVHRISDTQAVVATTDFFMPIVDDPRDFGRIAAANALSDIYAMGGRPMMALAILGMPLGKIEPEVVGAILAGGASICAEAGIPVAGGHSIDAPEPIYGLAVIGLVHPNRILRNAGGQAGDVLILTKPLGIGVLSAALKQGRIDDASALVASATKLNAVGADLADNPHVHAMTDVTGFGIAGHALEMARGSNLAVEVRFADLSLLGGVADLARDGVRSGAARRNWESYGAAVDAHDLEGWQQDLLCDPQTSGGLLVAVAPRGAETALATIRAAGFSQAAAIGHLVKGEPRFMVPSGA